MAAQHAPMLWRIHVIPRRQNSQAPTRIGHGGDGIGQNTVTAPGNVIEEWSIIGSAAYEIIAAVRGWTQYHIGVTQLSESTLNVFDRQRRAVGADGYNT